jgi:hypothetical protein
MIFYSILLISIKIDLSHITIFHLIFIDDCFCYRNLILSSYYYLFYRQEFEYFCEETRANVDRKRNAGITPLFCVEYSAPSYGSHCWSGDDHGDDDEGEDCEEDEYVLV